MKSNFWKNIKYIVLGGIIFCIVSAIAGISTISYWFSINTDYDVVNEFINDEQKKLGITCNELKIRSLNFITKNIGPIIDTGKQGKDWVSIITDQKLDEI